MLFSGIPFLLYFLPCALALYWACWFSCPLQNALLLVFSLIFYAWGEPLYLIPMVFLIVANHLLARPLRGYAEQARRTWFIRWAVAINIGTLILVRDGERIIRFLLGLAGVTLPDLHLPPAPLGVSFFALQACSYVLEVARRKARPERGIVNAGLFIAFLPTVVAGPILRFADLAPQLRERTPTAESIGLGCERIVVGLAKLLVLTVPLGNLAANVFNRSAAGNQFFSTPVTLAWLGVFAFGLQYYLTFSGFSDMAIGVARLFGFSIRENFRYPYGAHTVMAFWSRWHISLYRWFYVYIFLALGGARATLVNVRGQMRPKNYVVRNLFILWTLLGLWHGFSWNHFFFGFWFFVFTFFEWVVSLKRKNTSSVFWQVYVLVVVAVGWVLLRCRGFSESMTYLSNMIGVNSNGFLSDFAVTLIRENWLFLILGVLASTPVAGAFLRRLRAGREGVAGYVLAGCHLVVLLALLCLCYVFIGNAEFVPFVFNK